MLLKTLFRAFLAIFLADYSDFNLSYLLILLSTSVIVTKNNFCKPLRDAVLLSQFSKRVLNDKGTGKKV